MLDRRSTPRGLTIAPTVTDRNIVEVAGVLALVGLLVVSAVTRDWWLPRSVPPAVSAAAPFDRITEPGATSDGVDAAAGGAGPTGAPAPCWRFRTGGQIAAAPAVADGVVYAGSWEGHLYALEAATGALRWRYPTGNRIDAAAAVVAGVVYVAGADGFVAALDAASGVERWRVTTAAGSPSTPVIADGLLFVVSGPDAAAATVADGTVYVAGGGDNLHLQARDAATGVGIWHVRPMQDGVYALDAASGQERWFLDTGQPVRSSPVVDGRAVYAADGLFYRIDAATGALRWQTRSGTLRWQGLASTGSLLLATGDDAPTIVEGMGRISGWLVAVDAATGEERWRLPTGGPARSTPSAAGESVYVGGYDGNLYAVEAATGRERWRVALGEELLVTTVAGDRIYAGGGGSLFALGDDCPAPGDSRPSSPRFT